MRRIPNLETAIDECRKRGLEFSWEWNRNHIKFWIVGISRFIVICKNKQNPDRVRKDIERVLTRVVA